MVHPWAERESENALVGLAVQNLDLRTVRELGLKASMVGWSSSGSRLTAQRTVLGSSLVMSFVRSPGMP